MHLFSSGSNLEIGSDLGGEKIDWILQQHKVSGKSFPVEFLVELNYLKNLDFFSFICCLNRSCTLRFEQPSVQAMIF